VGPMREYQRKAWQTELLQVAEISLDLHATRCHGATRGETRVVALHARRDLTAHPAASSALRARSPDNPRTVSSSERAHRWS
jgi:hypothetical protein